VAVPGAPVGHAANSTMHIEQTWSPGTRTTAHVVLVASPAPTPLGAPFTRGAETGTSAPLRSPASFPLQSPSSPNLAPPAGAPGVAGSSGAPLLLGSAALLLLVLAGMPPALRRRFRIPPTLGPAAVFASPLERPG
jgi:hypothetical protein